MYEAKIIRDSICNGHRLTTMQLTHPRIVHAEFMTHRMFSKNASSSRAIPLAKMVAAVESDPFIPVHWGKNQKGMQAAEQLSPDEVENATTLWLMARDQAVASARALANVDGLNVHKQIANRLLEPFSWITVCCTGDAGAWSNYFSLRCHADAQPEIAKQAYMAQLAYFRNTPKQLHRSEWHLPYVSDEELDHGGIGNIEDWKKISAGRCARTSYLTQEGKRDIVMDMALHDRLFNHRPIHATPFEHVAKAMGEGTYANFTGWKSYRHYIPNEYVTDFKPNHPELVLS